MLWSALSQIGKESVLLAVTQHRSRGQILVMYAFMLTALLGFTALALDVGVALIAKHNYQKIAAVCALQGAQNFATGGNVASSVASCVQTNTGNTITTGSGLTVNIPPQRGAHSCANDPANCNKFVEVVIDKPQPTFFATIFGVNTLAAYGRAVAGGFAPAEYAMMSLQGGISSTVSSGTHFGSVDGNACSRGSWDINGQFTVNGQAVANQGFVGGNEPNASGGTITGGPPCLDPDYALPSPLPAYAAPPTTGTQCVLPASGQGSNDCNGISGAVVIPCVDGPMSVVDPAHTFGTVYVRCNDDDTIVRIYDRRWRVLIHPSNDAKVELMGASLGTTPPSDTGPGIFKTITSCNRPDPDLSFTNCGNANNQTPQITLKYGYYDRIDASKLSSTGSPSCGSYTAKICFKPGLYLLSTGFLGNNGLTVASQTTGPASPPAKGNGVSFVVGITFDPRGKTGGNGGLNLDCCAQEMDNYILIYHLGGCNPPYSDASNPPPSAVDPRTVFPVWPAATGGLNCTPSDDWRNELQLQGNNQTQVYNGSIYSPYQCADPPIPPGDASFPPACPSGSAASPPTPPGTRLPQYACGYPGNPSECIKVGGGSTQVNGQIVAPSIQYNGGGVAVDPPTGFAPTGQQPYLAE
ncbi:MAG TPA: Tad domain-containing protein [Gemmatimonadales bacterium]|nr:Tad domain-containing protein [Gemmatimonadales bacterium]